MSRNVERQSSTLLRSMVLCPYTNNNKLKTTLRGRSIKLFQKPYRIGGLTMGQAQGLSRKVDSNPSTICVRFVEDRLVLGQACIRIEIIYRRVSSGRTWQNMCSLTLPSTLNSTMWTGRMRGTTSSHARPQLTIR